MRKRTDLFCHPLLTLTRFYSSWSNSPIHHPSQTISNFFLYHQQYGVYKMYKFSDDNSQRTFIQSWSLCLANVLGMPFDLPPHPCLSHGDRRDLDTLIESMEFFLFRDWWWWWIYKVWKEQNMDMVHLFAEWIYINILIKAGIVAMRREKTERG